MDYLTNETKMPCRNDFTGTDLGKTVYYVCRWINKADDPAPGASSPATSSASPAPGPSAPRGRSPAAGWAGLGSKALLAGKITNPYKRTVPPITKPTAAHP